MYAWAKRFAYPPILQTLCYNCQWVKEIQRRALKRAVTEALQETTVRWKEGPAKGFCCRCKIKLTDQTARPSIVRNEYGLCRCCQGREDSNRADRIKGKVMAALGGRCQCCGENRLARLTIGHPEGDGNFHRQETGSGTRLYRKLVKDRLVSRFTLLVQCVNCNYGAYRNSGVCPHVSLVMTHSSQYYRTIRSSGRTEGSSTLR